MAVAFHTPGQKERYFSFSSARECMDRLRLALLVPLGRSVLSSRLHASVFLRCLLAIYGLSTLGYPISSQYMCRNINCHVCIGMSPQTDSSGSLGQIIAPESSTATLAVMAYLGGHNISYRFKMVETRFTYGAKKYQFWLVGLAPPSNLSARRNQLKVGRSSRYVHPRTKNAG